jgi:serine/threonine-protein kinase
VGHELSTGDILEGKYAIGPRLGAGGMGVVYRGEHITLGMKVAIKVLHPSEADDPTMIARFKAEARSAAAIRHQNVVEVTDFGLTPDRRPFFVMSYLRGESLADRLDRCRLLSERETVEIADQILQGLSAAHRRGVVHRDLKPENVFIAKGDDNREMVKLLDFGIAKILGGQRTQPGARDQSGRQLTMKGTVLGTPGYMAPETIEGEVAIDARADLFAVGVLMYEMITGRRPFTGVSPLEIMSQTVSQPVPRPSAFVPDISEAMERLILTALAKDPNDRFGDTEELDHHLTAAAVGRIPDDARPCRTRVGMPSVSPAPPRPVKQQPGSSSHAETTALEPRSPQPATKAPARAPARSVGVASPHGRVGRSSAPLVISPLLVLFLLALGGAAYYLFFYEEPFKIVEHESRTGRSPGKLMSDADREPDLGADDALLDPIDRESTEQVTIWLEVSPSTATVLWNGEPQRARPLVVDRDDRPGVLEVAAPGYVSQKREITPDEERTVSVKLKRRRASKRSRSNR